MSRIILAILGLVALGGCVSTGGSQGVPLTPAEQARVQAAYDAGLEAGHEKAVKKLTDNAYRAGQKRAECEVIQCRTKQSTATRWFSRGGRGLPRSRVYAGVTGRFGIKGGVYYDHRRRR